jgi:hypothetical protein
MAMSCFIGIVFVIFLGKCEEITKYEEMDKKSIA